MCDLVLTNVGKSFPSREFLKSQILGITVFKIFISGGLSSDIRSKIISFTATRERSR